MAVIIELDTFMEGPTDLSALKGIVPGEIKRIFYIYEANGQTRGGHRHHLTWNVLVCIKGKCRVYSHDGETEQCFNLDNTGCGLVLEPRDWHVMDCFSQDAILLVLSNQYYDKLDYIDQPYLLADNPEL